MEGKKEGRRAGGDLRKGRGRQSREKAERGRDKKRGRRGQRRKVTWGSHVDKKAGKKADRSVEREK